MRDFSVMEKPNKKQPLVAEIEVHNSNITVTILPLPNEGETPIIPTYQEGQETPALFLRAQELSVSQDVAGVIKPLEFGVDLGSNATLAQILNIIKEGTEGDSPLYTRLTELMGCITNDKNETPQEEKRSQMLEVLPYFAALSAVNTCYQLYYAIKNYERGERYSAIMGQKEATPLTKAVFCPDLSVYEQYLRLGQALEISNPEKMADYYTQFELKLIQEVLPTIEHMPTPVPVNDRTSLGIPMVHALYLADLESKKLPRASNDTPSLFAQFMVDRFPVHLAQPVSYDEEPDQNVVINYAMQKWLSPPEIQFHLIEEDLTDFNTDTRIQGLAALVRAHIQKEYVNRGWPFPEFPDDNTAYTNIEKWFGDPSILDSIRALPGEITARLPCRILQNLRNGQKLTEFSPLFIVYSLMDACRYESRALAPIARAINIPLTELLANINSAYADITAAPRLEIPTYLSTLLENGNSIVCSGLRFPCEQLVQKYNMVYGEVKGHNFLHEPWSGNSWKEDFMALAYQEPVFLDIFLIQFARDFMGRMYAAGLRTGENSLATEDLQKLLADLEDQTEIVPDYKYAENVSGYYGETSYALFKEKLIIMELVKRFYPEVANPALMVEALQYVFIEYYDVLYNELSNYRSFNTPPILMLYGADQMNPKHANEFLRNEITTNTTFQQLLQVAAEASNVVPYKLKEQITAHAWDQISFTQLWNWVEAETQQTKRAIHYSAIGFALGYQQKSLVPEYQYLSLLFQFAGRADDRQRPERTNTSVKIQEQTNLGQNKSIELPFWIKRLLKMFDTLGVGVETTGIEYCNKSDTLIIADEGSDTNTKLLEDIISKGYSIYAFGNLGYPSQIKERLGVGSNVVQCVNPEVLPGTPLATAITKIELAATLCQGKQQFELQTQRIAFILALQMLRVAIAENRNLEAQKQVEVALEKLQEFLQTNSSYGSLFKLSESILGEQGQEIAEQILKNTDPYTEKALVGVDKELEDALLLADRALGLSYLEELPKGPKVVLLAQAGGDFNQIQRNTVISGLRENYQGQISQIVASEALHTFFNAFRILDPNIVTGLCPTISEKQKDLVLDMLELIPPELFDFDELIFLQEVFTQYTKLTEQHKQTLLLDQTKLNQLHQLLLHAYLVMADNNFQIDRQILTESTRAARVQKIGTGYILT